MLSIFIFTRAWSLGKLEFRPAFQIIDCRIEKLFYDFWVPFSALQNLDEKQPCLYPKLSKCWIRRPIWFVSDLPIAANIMTVWRRLEKFLQQKFYQETCGGSQAVVDCIGHTHIDVAWLWTFGANAGKGSKELCDSTRPHGGISGI